MKTRKTIQILIVILFSINIKAAGPPNPNCMPFSSCWCQKNPGHPNCMPTKVSIEGGLGLLIIAGIGLAIYYRKKMDINNNKEYWLK